MVTMSAREQNEQPLVTYAAIAMKRVTCWSPEKMLPLALINICFLVDIPKDASLSRLSEPNHNVPHMASQWRMHY